MDEILDFMWYNPLCFLGVSKLKIPSNTPAYQSIDSICKLFYRKNDDDDDDDGLLGLKYIAYWGKKLWFYSQLGLC